MPLLEDLGAARVRNWFLPGRARLVNRVSHRAVHWGSRCRHIYARKGHFGLSKPMQLNRLKHVEAGHLGHAGMFDCFEIAPRCHFEKVARSAQCYDCARGRRLEFSVAAGVLRLWSDDLERHIIQRPVHQQSRSGFMCAGDRMPDGYGYFS